MNSVNLIGNLTKEIELKKTNSNVSVCSFTLAVRKNYKNEKGEYDTDFISCIAWKQSAEFISKYANKGDKIAVTGSIQVRSYEKQDGTKQYITEVVCNNVEICHKVESQNDKAEKPKENNNIDTSDLPFM